MGVRTKSRTEGGSTTKALEEIKLLLVAGLLKDGVRQGDIAALLGVSPATLSKLLPSGERSFRGRGAG